MYDDEDKDYVTDELDMSDINQENVDLSDPNISVDGVSIPSPATDEDLKMVEGDDEDDSDDADITGDDKTVSNLVNAKPVAESKKVERKGVAVSKTGVINNSLQKGEEFRKTGEEEKMGRKNMARILGNIEQGEQLNESLQITMEKLRQVLEQGGSLISKMDNARSEMRKTNESAIQVNQQMESSVSQIKEFFQNDYQSLLNDSNRRQMSSYLTQSRDGYMTLFHLAVKNFKQFSESAIKWQKKMETDSGKELKQIYGITKYMPYLFVGILVLQIITLVLVFSKLQ